VICGYCDIDLGQLDSANMDAAFEAHYVKSPGCRLEQFVIEEKVRPTLEAVRRMFKP